MIKGIYEKPTANIILNGERLQVSPLRQKQNKDAPDSGWMCLLKIRTLKTCFPQCDDIWR